MKILYLIEPFGLHGLFKKCRVNHCTISLYFPIDYCVSINQLRLSQAFRFENMWQVKEAHLKVVR